MLEISEYIFKVLTLEEENRKIKLIDCSTYDIENFEFEKTMFDVQEHLLVKLKTGKYSKVLLEQLSLHMGNRGEIYVDEVLFFQANIILNLIENIESNVEEGKPFYGKILKGLLHSHHNTFAGRGYSFLRNVKEYWYRNGKIKDERVSDFQEVIAKYGEKNLETIYISICQIAIAKKELKGEWLIYRIHNNVKYYLCLATHKEEDIDIYNTKIKSCYSEFPEIDY